LLFRSNTIFDANGATIKLAEGLPSWGYRGCPIREEKAMLMIAGNSASNVVLKNLTVDGSQSDYYSDVALGTSLYNMATLIGCNGLTIEDCIFQNGCNDAVLLNNCSGVDIDRITVDKCGHDGIYAYYVDVISVKNSSFVNRTNSSCRFYNVTKGEFLNNKCSTSGGGHTGLQLQGELKDILASGNYIKGLPYPGIRAIDAKMANVVIEDNVIEKCKSPGIDAPSAILRNNKITY
jgi:polygalacturonase